MATRKILKSVLNSFIGTFSSRYTEYDGYWIFGFLVDQLNVIKIDLLGQDSISINHSAQTAVVAGARTKFKEQASKAGLSIESIRTASLEIRRLSGSKNVSLIIK